MEPLKLLLILFKLQIKILIFQKEILKFYKISSIKFKNLLFIKKGTFERKFIFYEKFLIM